MKSNTLSDPDNTVELKRLYEIVIKTMGVFAEQLNPNHLITDEDFKFFGPTVDMEKSYWKNQNNFISKKVSKKVCIENFVEYILLTKFLISNCHLEKIIKIIKEEETTNTKSI